MDDVFHRETKVVKKDVYEKFIKFGYMTPTIQKKIDEIIALSKVKRSESTPVEINKTASNDSLLKAIRNKKEADIFLAELDLAIKMARAR